MLFFPAFITCRGHMILDPDDCGWVATLTVLDNRNPAGDRCLTRRFVAYIQRQAEPKGVMILRERTADGLGPVLGSLTGPKEGIVQLDADVNTIIVTYTGRAPGDLTGPFQLQEERIAVPGVWPLALAGVVRVRGVANIIKASVPSAGPAIDPYTK